MSFSHPDYEYWQDLEAERAEREAAEAEFLELLPVARGGFQEMGAKMRQSIHAERTYALNHGRAA